jgi:hypothetical protein
MLMMVGRSRPVYASVCDAMIKKERIPTDVPVPGPVRKAGPVDPNPDLHP